MEDQVERRTKTEYVQLNNRMKMSSRAFLVEAKSIRKGQKSLVKDGVVLRGDLAEINLGQYCIIGENAVLRPMYRRYKTSVAYVQLQVGDFVHIGRNSVVQAAQVGNCVYIGENCVVGRRCVLSDCCYVEDNTYLPPDTVVAPFVRIGGQPGRVLGELPESFETLHAARMRQLYHNLQIQ